MATPSIQTLITQAQQVLNLQSSNEIRATLAAVLANANVGTPLNPNLTTQQLWDEFDEIVRQSTDDIMSIVVDQMMRMVFSPPAPGGAGADKQVIFNDGGVLAGDAGLTYNKATDALTITGDLTVDTSTLKVDSALNKVGVNVATLTGLQTFNVAGDVGITSDLVLKNSGGTVQGYIFGSSGLNYRVIAGQPHVWQEGGTDLMRLNSTGLGVGASPSYQLHVAKSQASQTAIYVDNQQNNAAASSALTLSAYGGYWNLSVPQSSTFVNPLIFKFGSTEMMRLDASGNLLVGKTATGFGTVGNEVKANGEVFSTQASTSNVASTYHVYSTGAAAYRFYVGMGGTVFATNTTISAISDARFKENVQDIDVGLGAILALKPRKFDWKAGKGKDIKGDRGFIAQEFEQVFPQLVDEWADPAPEGEAPYKSVRQDLIPVLVKAIQELTARVQNLEAK